MHTIAICDTEPIVIEGLLRLVEPVEGLRVVAAESTIIGGMDAVRELRPSVLIVDKAFGLQSVMDCFVALRRDFRSMPVMVWGSSVTEPEVLRLIQAGVAGVVRKSAPLASILLCIQAVVSGGTWMEAPLQMEFGRPVGPGHSPLTARELQVLELVERGYKNKDIAVSLGIRIGTVKIHVKHIFEKTGVRGRFGLAISGMRQRTHSVGMAAN
ncbi:MAG TPA: response regulator transcription factor [Candidatus Limnocylindrales bacterium]|nr:response regulator transcription factor [Candidatus Limnocylindrales bacterium]